MTKKGYYSNEVMRALKRKGFTEGKGKQKHIRLYLTINGKKTHVKTYVSKGKKQVPRGIMKKMSSQLKMESKEEFEKYLECSYSLMQYINDLRGKNIIEI